MQQLISAEMALSLLSKAEQAFLDVRSEGEFADGRIFGFTNLPILNNSERHAVGLCYKQKGQEEAIKLGYEMVQPFRNERVSQWLELVGQNSKKDLIVMCWRGGLRSKIACEWLTESHQKTFQVVGGYKAMRAILMEKLMEVPPLVVLAGMTGSQKTLLLNALPMTQKIDLENLAAHRGSSFGALSDRSQPSQATFENDIAVQLGLKLGPVLIEDESTVIGSLHLPKPLKQKMITAPVIWLEAPLLERVYHVFHEYVVKPIVAGSNPSDHCAVLLANIRKLAPRLGRVLTDEICNSMLQAFASKELSELAHSRWIEILLHDYYDKAYLYAFQSQKRHVVFRGNYQECFQWIQHKYA